VLLGVLEYLYDPLAALIKVAPVAQSIILSYCTPRGPGPHPSRRARGWVNALSEHDLIGAISAAGLSLNVREDFDSADDFEQRLFVFSR
jgi:hypothetical protein